MVHLDGNLPGRQLSRQATYSGSSLIFLNLKATLNLSSRIGSQSLLLNIAILATLISSNPGNTLLVAPLLRPILEQAKDEVIWSIAFELNDRTRPKRLVTPPTSAPPFQQTSWTYKTGSLADTSESRNHMDTVLKREIEPRNRLDVPDLQQACFGSIADLEQLAQKAFVYMPAR